MTHTEPLTKFIQQILSSLTTEMSPVRKAVLQNRVALDIFTASQEDTCVTIQTEYCVFTHHESADVSLLNHMRTQ